MKELLQVNMNQTEPRAPPTLLGAPKNIQRPFGAIQT